MSGATNSPDASKSARGPESWVEDHGDVLFHYAFFRVRNKQVAEDLVQETLLAGIRGYEKFSQRSTIRSWLCGILKNKIIDHYRKLGRETSFTDMEFLSDEFPFKFVPGDFWNHDEGPKDWKPASDEIAYSAEFWQTMADCLAKLPQRIADVFMLREMDEVPTKQLCEIAGVTENNLWVMLHRARMALRECLELNWFVHPRRPGR